MCNLEETNSERSPPVRSAGKRSEHKEPVRAKKKNELNPQIHQENMFGIIP